MEDKKLESKYMGVPIVSKILCEESDRKPVSSAWTKDGGLLIPSSYASGRDSCPIMIRIPHDICKEMVKDLMEEILKEQSDSYLTKED